MVELRPEPRLSLADQAFLNAAAWLCCGGGAPRAENEQLVLTILREELPRLSGHERMNGLARAVETGLLAMEADSRHADHRLFAFVHHIQPEVGRLLSWRFAGAYDALRAQRGLEFEAPATAAE